MKRMAALAGALLLTLVLTAPAAANYTVFQFEDQPFGPDEEPVSMASWGFDCGPGNPVYYGSYGTETLKWWAANDAIPFVDPWIKGQYRRDGVDYFSTGPGMSGTVVSGRFGFTSHLYAPDFSGDLPKWTETVTGTFWGIKLPGYGPIFKEAGNTRQSAEVRYDPVFGEYIDYVPLRDMRGVSRFDVEALCSALGY
jgi:hypothetical protein